MKALKTTLWIIAANAAIALAGPLISWWFGGVSGPRALANQYLFSLIYTFSIATPMFVIFPWVWDAFEPLRPALRWPSRFIAALAMTTAGCVVGGLLIIVFQLSTPDRFWTMLNTSFRSASFITVIVSSFITMYEHLTGRLNATTLQLRTKELERERALKAATQAQLASLESRIHPHFLFNALNSISSLIKDDPVRAEQLLGDMAALLRFSLDSKQAGVVPLDREMEIVRGYLDIEAARFGPRLRFEIDIPDETTGAMVPPLAVQTLVENSIKHAVAPRRTGGFVEVTARRRAGQLAVEVWDDGDGFKDISFPPGHGLENLKERLHALFGDRSALEVAQFDGGTQVRLSIPQ